jgi:hypothetical protein
LYNGQRITMYGIPLQKATPMLRIFSVAALVLLSSPAFAQSNDPVKGFKYGVGCIGAISTYAPRLETCVIADAKSRIWCPNGQIFERTASSYEKIPSSYVVRAICNMNQVL